MSIVKWTGRRLLQMYSLIQALPWWMTATMILSVVLMNLLANKCILALPWLALDGGYVISWCVFLLMDIVVKTRGAKVANCLSVVALLFNLVCSAVFMGIAALPGEWSLAVDSTTADAVNAAMDGLFSGSWYVLLGSALAFLVSAFVNNGMNAAIGLRVKSDSFAAFAVRSYVSTAVGQFVDNLIFSFVVSRLFFGWTSRQCVISAACCALFELSAEIMASPLGYWLCRLEGIHSITYLQARTEK